MKNREQMEIGYVKGFFKSFPDGFQKGAKNGIKNMEELYINQTHGPRLMYLYLRERQPQAQTAALLGLEEDEAKKAEENFLYLKNQTAQDKQEEKEENEAIDYQYVTEQLRFRYPDLTWEEIARIYLIPVEEIKYQKAYQAGYALGKRDGTENAKKIGHYETWNRFAEEVRPLLLQRKLFALMKQKESTEEEIRQMLGCSNPEMEKLQHWYQNSHVEHASCFTESELQDIVEQMDANDIMKTYLEQII